MIDKLHKQKRRSDRPEKRKHVDVSQLQQMLADIQNPGGSSSLGSANNTMDTLQQAMRMQQVDGQMTINQLLQGPAQLAPGAENARPLAAGDAGGIRSLAPPAPDQATIDAERRRNL